MRTEDVSTDMTLSVCEMQLVCFVDYTVFNVPIVNICSAVIRAFRILIEYVAAKSQGRQVRDLLFIGDEKITKQVYTYYVVVK